jgi:hypothetical protein
MHEVYLTSVRDNLLVAIPFIAVLALGIFRLDALFFASKGLATRRRPGCFMDENGELLLADPDGKLSRMRPKRKYSDGQASDSR